jgi:hypothetical protein
LIVEERLCTREAAAEGGGAIPSACSSKEGGINLFSYMRALATRCTSDGNPKGAGSARQLRGDI